MLSLAPVLAKYVRDVVPRGACQAEVESCLAVCRVLGLLQIVNNGLVAAAELGDAIARRAALRRAADGAQPWKPKDHWVLHSPGQLLRHGILLSMFLMGRKHRSIKR